MLVNLSYLNLDTHKLKKMSPGAARGLEKMLSGNAGGLTTEDATRDFTQTI